MTTSAHKTEGVNRTKTIRFYPFIFTGNDPRKGWRIPLNEIKYNEQRDEETGFGYFGARYMDHELMTMWLSVDPMADKYPSISPYAYCAWSPVKLVDPDGRDVEIVKNDSDKKVTIRANFYYNKNQLGGEADVFIEGFMNAIHSWEDDIRTALADESLGAYDYSINFDFNYIECDDAKKSANNDRIGNSLSNNDDCPANAIVANNKHLSANINLHSRGNNQDAYDLLFYSTSDYQGTLKHEIGHFFGLFDCYPEARNPAPSISDDLMDKTIETRGNAVEPFKRVWRSADVNNRNPSVLINNKNRETW